MDHRSKASSKGFSSAARRRSGTCTSSPWTPGRADSARDGCSFRNRSGSSGLAEPTTSLRPSRETTIRRCTCSSPSGSSESPAGSCGGGTAGVGCPSRCGCSWLPMRSSSCALSPTSLPRHLKRSPGPLDRGGVRLHGWIIDAYGDYDRDSMVLWLWNERGAHRIEDPRFLPTFYLHAAPVDLPEIRRRTGILDGVREVREVSRRIALEDDEPKSVLEIVPRHYRDIRELAHILDSNGGYIDHRLYNVDLRFSQRYAMDHGLFPMGLVRYGNGIWTPEEEHFALEYPLPPLNRTLLDLHVDNPAGIPRMQDKLLGARIDGVEIDGSEESILKGIDEVIRSKDPDILMTDGGDAFVMPYLARKAAERGVTMKLGRDPDKFAERKGKSYFTYGKIVFKPGQYILRGRLHLDRGHFAMRESDFAGLAELSRLSTLTPQEQARLTPGTAFTAMQTNLAYQDGCLVVWKKNRPEDFKDAENLLRGDRGGFTFEPEVGVHEGLYELDFSSLYPSIMVKY